ncbi:type II and III secretion system protein family protein [Pseudoxanthomonas sp. UTMC 1351]|uniref:type II and III secretion system protein family protein n=1 Tax=Pseudoxanthomonas sp. UTMC 1351 TaxID=2695853 RepID=UPI0034CF981B
MLSTNWFGSIAGRSLLCMGMVLFSASLHAQKQTQEPPPIIEEVQSPPTVAAMASLALHPATAAQITPLPSQINLYMGQAVVHRVNAGLKRIAVGSGEVVEVKNLGRRELVIIGSKPGDTSIHFWMQDGSQLDVPVHVRAGNAGNLADTVRTLMADVPGLQVHAVGDHVVMTGKELSGDVAGRIGALQKVYPQVLNFTSTDPVGMRQMVLIDVQIMEFNRNSLEELGIRWDSVIDGPTGGLIKDFTTNDYFRTLPEGSPFDDLDLPTRISGTQAYFGIATSIASRINLLKNQGKAFLLASPQLSARSGGEAKFLVGGEVPIPVSSLFGQTQVEFKEYGIRLNIEPLVNANNEISTRFMAEVSRVDPSVSVDGIPGFITRRSESEINVRSGQTIVVSGLVDSSAAKTADKFPVLGEIPILGRLFRSDGFRGNRTDLVVFLTPRVITPTSPENQEAIRKGEQIREQASDTLRKRDQDLVH